MKRKGHDTLAIKGFLRLQIVDKKTRKVIGDTGLRPNQITNYGKNSCFLAAVVGAAGSVQILGAMLGNGTNPASNATALDTPNTDYFAAVATAINGSTQLQFTASFDGTLGAATLANMGLFGATDYAATNSLICGKTFASSAVATTQDVNMTYNINYATA